MRKLLLGAMSVGLIVVAGPALADAGGSTERNNQVECGSGDLGVPSPTGGQVINASIPRGGQGTDNSLVLCSDDDLGADGRVIIGNGGDGGGQICMDGDDTNATPLGLATSGWACLRGGWGEDADGLRCQWHDDPSTDVDDRNSQRATGSPEECPIAIR